MSSQDKQNQEWVTAQAGLAHMAAGEALYQRGGPMLKEFKEFAMRGNVLDMAVGIVIGASFGRIIGSFVDDILMPPIGLLLGRVDFANLFLNLSGQRYETLTAAKEAGAATLNYGVFFNTVINFLIVAFAIFLLIRQVNRFKRAQEASFGSAQDKPAPTMRECPYCLLAVPLKARKCGHCTSQLQTG